MGRTAIVIGFFFETNTLNYTYKVNANIVAGNINTIPSALSRLDEG